MPQYDTIESEPELTKCTTLAGEREGTLQY